MQLVQATQVAKVETERNMTAYFAHELRNPLSAIDSALDAMPGDLPPMAMELVSGMQLCSSFMSSIMVQYPCDRYRRHRNSWTAPNMFVFQFYL